MTDRATTFCWIQELRWRMRRHALLKFLGTALFMSVFFVAYFHVLRHPIFPVSEMPLTFVDRIVRFYPPALILYASLWLYVGLPPAFLLNVRELVAYGIWVGALCVAGLICFVVWPTAIPSQVLDFEHFPGFQILAGVDAKANACPSLHVATALFSALWLERILKDIGAGVGARAGNWIWCAAITYSTLAIKQHVALDALGGIALGLLFGLLSLRAIPRSNEKLEPAFRASAVVANLQSPDIY